MYHRVFPLSRSFDTYGLVYAIPEHLGDIIHPGMMVYVPIRNILSLAVVGEEVNIESLTYDAVDIKEINSLLSDISFLSREQCDVISFVARQYICPIHHAVGLFFPKNLQEKIVKNTLNKLKNIPYNYENIKEIILSSQQDTIYNKIQNSDLKKHLLYGVTGSGKTEIYMKIISENLKNNKQTLLLIPEIILTSQIGLRIREVFGKEVILLNSSVTAAKRTQYWMDVFHGNAKIIIGTRSALFYPYNNLATIIIDEEHDQSYISDSAPRYHSVEVAEKLSEIYNIPLILASGTPKVKTFYRALKGEFQVLQLLEKYK